MAIIKKVGKFIASRALYFTLGILIAIGATYAYATWEQAKTTTTNPGELSEANWNELVTMIESEIGGGYSVVAMSGESAIMYDHSGSAVYCYNLSAAAEVAMDGDTSTIYTDWRLPTVEEAAVFEGTIVDTSYISTATIDSTEAVIGRWIGLNLSNGSWSALAYGGFHLVRCVR